MKTERFIKVVQVCMLSLVLVVNVTHARSRMCPVDGGPCVGSSYTPVPPKRIPRVFEWLSRQFGMWRHTP